MSTEKTNRYNQIIQTALICIAAVALVFGAIQTLTIKADYEARTRPYLVINNIDPQIEKGYENWFPLLITIENFGEVPATNVCIESIIMGGENIVWISEGSFVTPPQYQDSRSDLLFISRRPNRMMFPVDRKTWETTIRVGTSMEIELDYFWREKHYWYVAEMTFESEDNWVIKSERTGIKIDE